MAIMVRYLDGNKYISQYVYIDPNDIVSAARPTT